MNQFEKFENFLDNPDLYEDLEHFWLYEISKITKGHLHAWTGNEYANGKKIYDGNPIFSFWQPNKRKAIRIIQNEINPIRADLLCWMKKAFDQEGNQVSELAIALQL